VYIPIDLFLFGIKRGYATKWEAWLCDKAEPEVSLEARRRRAPEEIVLLRAEGARRKK
jgi:hypothetical protein